MANDPLHAVNQTNDGAGFLGRSWQRWGQLARFVFFGSLNTLLAYGLYLLLLLVVSYPLAYTASYVAGIFISYWLNARFVFRQKLKVKNALQYPSIYVIQYVVGISLLYVIVEMAQISRVIAPFIVALAMIPLAYHLSRHVIQHGLSLKRRRVD